VAPSASAMRRMLMLCYEYADEYSLSSMPVNRNASVVASVNHKYRISDWREFNWDCSSVATFSAHNYQ